MVNNIGVCLFRNRMVTISEHLNMTIVADSETSKTVKQIEDLRVIMYY